MKNILVIDDSALMRRVISDIINKDGKLHTDTSARDGLEGLEILESGKKFDAIILDINMPRMDGLEFLRNLNQKKRKEKVIIVSMIAKEGAKETIEALELGAFDFVHKPDSLSEVKGPSFGNRLTQIIYTAVGLDSAERDVNMNKRFSAVLPLTGRAKAPKSDRFNHSKGVMELGKTKLVALACSTGGPKALQRVVPYLPANLDAAVLIVQHMPVGFTESLSIRLNELSHMHVKEAKDGEVIQKGTIYIARGGSQMRLIEKSKKEHRLSVQEEEARNGLRPCADIMYESLMRTGFDDITCVVLTGMGADGTKGIMKLEQTNKIYVIAQDEASCTVYGMPKALAETGAVDEVQSLENIADAITKHVGVR